jgi:hypothetical protein
VIRPARPGQAPLEFAIHQLKLSAVGPGRPMCYHAVLTNAKPPGLITAQGSFGPWVAEAPALTALEGDYDFRRANLSVFQGIAGTLSSRGHFAGLLQRFTVDGTADTPDFRLKSAGQPVPLKTRFHAIVDETDGDTLLQPAIATLGRATFACQGGVTRGAGEAGKRVSLDVALQQRDISDVLRLAVKGDRPFLRGAVQLRMQFKLPPGRGEIADRLRITGRFRLDQAHFTSPEVQEKIDDFSRKGQGRPADRRIGEVPSNLAGTYLRIAITGARAAPKFELDKKR